MQAAETDRCLLQIQRREAEELARQSRCLQAPQAGPVPGTDPRALPGPRTTRRLYPAGSDPRALPGPRTARCLHTAGSDTRALPGAGASHSVSAPGGCLLEVPWRKSEEFARQEFARQLL